MTQLITRIRKKQGYLVNFDRDQVYDSIKKTFAAVYGANHSDTIEQVVKYIESKVAGYPEKSISVPRLLDLMQNALTELGHTDVAAAFKAYRENKEQIRKASKIKIDVE